MPFVDTDVFVGLLKADDPFHNAAVRLLAAQNLYTSTMVLIELALVARREISEPLSRQLPEVLNFKGKIVPFTAENFSASTTLRQKYNLGIFDAAHAAAAMHADKAIISSDKAFDQIPNLRRIPLD